MPEPAVWIVRGGMEVRAESNAIVVQVRRGMSDAEIEEQIRAAAERDFPALAAQIDGLRQGRAQALLDEAADAQLRAERAAQGLDGVTGLPARREVVVQPLRRAVAGGRP